MFLGIVVVLFFFQSSNFYVHLSPYFQPSLKADYMISGFKIEHGFCNRMIDMTVEAFKAMASMAEPSASPSAEAVVY